MLEYKQNRGIACKQFILLCSNVKLEFWLFQMKIYPKCFKNCSSCKSLPCILQLFYSVLLILFVDSSFSILCEQFCFLEETSNNDCSRQVNSIRCHLIKIKITITFALDHHKSLHISYLHLCTYFTCCLKPV